MKIKNNIKKDVLFLILYLALFFILSNSDAQNFKLPFSSAMSFVLLYEGANVFFIVPCYFIAYVLTHLSYQSIVIAISSSLSLILGFIISKISRKKLSIVSIMLFYVLGQVGFIYFNIYSAQKIIETIIQILIGICFIYIASLTLNTFKKKNIEDFLIDERICCYMFLTSIFIGLSEIYIAKFSVSELMSLIIICAIFFYKGKKYI